MVSDGTNSLESRVRGVVASTPVHDIHTHLCDPAFGDLLLWGIDDLLVYHYLIAEAFRFLDVPFEQFFALPKASQADVIWRQLFVEHSPISEACRGVITTLHKLGIDPQSRDLPLLREWFSHWTPEKYTTHCMELANVASICMTNSPFDPQEVAVWDAKPARDARFKTGLRIDPLLVSWDATIPTLRGWGYEVTAELNAKTIAEVMRFLRDWTQRIDPEFLMVSLPPDFQYPGKGACPELIEKAVLPFCLEVNRPFALMMGVKRAVNPQLRLAGDGVGRSDLTALQNLCAAHPRNKFLCTALSRENQHELCVLARKFRNLHIFGCWWFTNIPQVVEEITAMRMELLGMSFTPQHSDARVLDQLIYKWDHSREIIAKALTRQYEQLEKSGWQVTDSEMKRDVTELFGGGCQKFSSPDYSLPN